MDIITAQIKKYFLLLAGAYIAVRLAAYMLLFLSPDILVRHITPLYTRIYSPDDLILLFEYFSYLVIAFIMSRDMKKTGLLSIPVLLITCFSGESGIALYLIMIFANTHFNPLPKHENI